MHQTEKCEISHMIRSKYRGSSQAQSSQLCRCVKYVTCLHVQSLLFDFLKALSLPKQGRKPENEGLQPFAASIFNFFQPFHILVGWLLA